MSKITGEKALIKGVDGVLEDSDKALKSALKKAAGFVRDDARLRAPSRTEDLLGSIFDRIEKIEGGYRAIVSTNSDHAMYVEFGTGPNGEASHEGISPEVTPRYSQSGWMIPADKMPLKLAEFYGFRIIKKGEEILGYGTNGQPARPYMYPALQDNIDQIQTNLAKAVATAVKKGALKK